MNRFDYLCALALVLGGVACSGTPSGDAGRVTGFSERSTGKEAAVVVSNVSPALSGKPSVAEPLAKALPAGKGLLAVSTVKVKRLVVTSGVKDREPVSSADALPSDGSPIYAFAELANPEGESENVRITFERKGGAERVGNVTLPVPAKVSRHRTWATTRFIRAAGVWEAVLWNESGGELGRTSFEVGAASS